MSESVASMKKWGIPQQKPPEITLLERLVWVRYKTFWWPALLYHSYWELQHHLYDQLDMVLKAQFAMAIMHQMQEKRKVKVARLLGRSILEVIEVDDDCYCEFYWQLPNVLAKACKQSHYGENVDLYFDFHRALDQVEDIIREVSQENFALMPNTEQQTWLERAHAAVNAPDDQASVNLYPPAGQSAALPRARSNETKSNSTIATNEVNTAIAPESAGAVNSFDDQSKKSKGGKDRNVKVRSRAGTVSDISVSGSTKSSNRVAANQLAQRHTVDIAPSSSQASVSSRNADIKSRRSVKSKISQAQTEKVDNRTTKVDKPQEPSPPAVIEESRDPSSDGPAASDVTILRKDSPLQVLPGLEGDDILPGLSAKVEGARSTWMNVLGFMSMSRDDPPQGLESPAYSPATLAPTGLDRIQEDSTVPTQPEKPVVAPMAAETTAPLEAEIVLHTPQRSPTFWQRMTCHTGE